MGTMEAVLGGLRAAAEPTRLRLLRLCLEGGALTVSELIQIVGQSQPRVSRHLKLLCAAGLLDRYPEGAWVFYRPAEHGGGADLVRHIADLLPADDPLLARDRQRLALVKAARAEQAAAYFRENARHWDEIRSLYVDEAEVESALLKATPATIEAHLDIGTGTGRLLEVLAGRVTRGIGIDLSHDMLTIARANLERAGIRHCDVRHGDMYHLPFEAAGFDLVTIHQVLHFADAPERVVGEAARVLRPGGLLAIIDFAPHDLEFLRKEHAHRRLGFGDGEVASWCRGAGLRDLPPRLLPGAPLTVCVWTALAPPAPLNSAGERVKAAMVAS